MPRAGMGRAFGASECERTGRCARFEFVVVWGLELNRTPRCFCSCGFPFSHWCGPASPPTSGAKPRPHPSLGQRPRLPIDQSPRAEGPAQCGPANKSGLQPCPISCGQTPGLCPGLGWGAPLALTGRDAVLKLAQGKPPTTGRRRSHNQPARARAGAPEGGRAPRDRRCRANVPRLEGQSPGTIPALATGQGSYAPPPRRAEGPAHPHRPKPQSSKMNLQEHKG